MKQKIELTGTVIYPNDPEYHQAQGIAIVQAGIRPAPFQVGIFEIVWPWNQLEEVIDVWQRWSPSVDERLGTILEIGTKTNGLLRSQGIFLGPKAELGKLILPL
ncbi:hypothetical protein [Clostridium sp.]|jgi:hypothetical protein|uniref:hypothetical protein n=1 Tax=Clostridium sp. TaxID=1506 RepID=UPI003EE9DA70